MESPSSTFKQRRYALFARIGHALASDRRLELLDLLAQAPRHVEALAAETGMSVASTSQHLQVLRNVHLVEAEREGTKIRYRLAGDDVLRLWLTLRSVAEDHLAEVGQLVREFSVEGAEGEEVWRRDLEALVAADRITLIDVRPRIEYEAGHVPGALSVPLDELPSRLSALPKGKRIVAYCRGEYCQMADEAVALLRQRGFEAALLDGGWPEWRAEGRPTE
ncbi:MAG: ArsR family transcriptional regulator [Dehalococcoidia bacterium]